MKTSIKNFNNHELGRFLLRRLYQIHDASGVSLGRSERSFLNEAILDIFPLPDGADFFKYSDLMFEAEKRGQKKRKTFQQFLLCDNLNMLHTHSLIYLILLKLKEWYKKDAKKMGYPLAEEMKIVDITIPMFFPSEYINNFLSVSQEELIEESKERSYWVFKNKKEIF